MKLKKNDSEHPGKMLYFAIIVSYFEKMKGNY